MKRRVVSQCVKVTKGKWSGETGRISRIQRMGQLRVYWVKLLRYPRVPLLLFRSAADITPLAGSLPAPEKRARVNVRISLAAKAQLEKLEQDLGGISRNRAIEMAIESLARRTG